MITVANNMKSLLVGLLSSRRSQAAVGLAVAVGLTEGLTLLLLVPLLQLAGIPLQGNVGSLSASLAVAFNVVGIQPTLVTVLLVYVALTFVQATLTRAKVLADALAIQQYSLALRMRLYSAIARTKWLVISRIRSSDFTFALTTAVDETESGASNLLFFVANSFVALVYIMLAFRVSVEMSAIVLGAAILLLAGEWAGTLLGLTRGGKVTSTTNELYATAAEQLGGLKTAKSYGQEERHLSLFLNVTKEINAARLALTRTFAALRWRTAIGSVTALSLVLYLAVGRLQLPTATILLLLFLFSRLVPRLVGLQQTFQEILSTVPALQTIERLIDQCECAPEQVDAHQSPVSLTKSIELRDLSFSYMNPADISHLSHVTMRIPAGRTTAIVGVSGAGKSTIADILLGLITPHSGAVVVDGVALDPSHLYSWRSQIGYVAQDTFLFNETIRFNLEWGQPNATESKMLDALKHAAAFDFVSRLPAGIDTVIGERGIRLSGGERQRLSLARALLRHPRLLLLDEATSALDSENEERIYSAINGLHGEITIVIVTHRLSTIRDADIIYLLDRGSVVASGKWEDLISGNNPQFREMCRAQGIS